MATLTLSMPLATQKINLPITEDTSALAFGFDLADAIVERVEDDFVISFESTGSSIVLEDFYATYSDEFMPDFLVDGETISGEDFFAALDPNLMPAAGPAADTAVTGGRFYDLETDALDSGINALDGLQGGSAYDRTPFLVEGTGAALVNSNSTIVVDNTPTLEFGEGATSATSAEHTTFDDKDIDAEIDGDKKARVEKGSFTAGNMVDGGGGEVTITYIDENGLEQTVEIFNTDTPFAEITLETEFGKLTITDYDPATGEFTYKYKQTGAQDHSKGDVTDNFQITVSDRDGNPNDDATGSITIDIVDVAPDAKDDVDRGTEDSAKIAGNVITGKGTEAGKENADEIGEDGWVDKNAKLEDVTASNQYTKTDNNGVASNEDVTWTETSSGIFESELGTITFQPNGRYEFVPSDSLQEMNKGEELSFEFNYTIKDSDGSTDSAKLTIVVEGKNDRTELSFGDEPGTSNALHETFDDKKADNGDGSARKEFGSFTADNMVDGGGGEVTITYTDENGLPQSVEIYNTDEAFKEITLKTEFGKLTITDYDPTTGKFTYEYKQVGVHDHSEGALNDKFTITVSDRDGNPNDDATGDIVINIVDDAPEAKADSASIGEVDEISGNLLNGSTNSGDQADKAGADGKLTFVDVTPANTNSDTLTWTQVEGDTLSFEVKDVSGNTLGTLTFKADGSYTLSYNDPSLLDTDVLTSTFKYTVKDADGTTSESTLTVTITGDNDKPKITFGDDPDATSNAHTTYDAGVDGVTASGKYGGSATADGSFKVDGGDELDKVTIKGFDVDGNPVEFDISSYTADELANLTIYGEYGTLTDITFNESGDVTYTYTQTETFDHDNAKNPNGSTKDDDEVTEPEWLTEGNYNKDTTLGDKFEITVYDKDGETATGSIDITIVDDVVVLGNLAVEGDAYADPNANGKYDVPTASENVDGEISSVVNGKLDVKGADGDADEPIALEIVLPENYWGTVDYAININEDGTPRVLTLVFDGDSVIGVLGEGTSDPYFTFKLNDDGTWTYEQLKPFTGDVNIAIKGTDADGDSDTHFVTFEGTGEGFSTPPSAEGGTIMLDESGLADGTTPDAGDADVVDKLASTTWTPPTTDIDGSEVTFTIVGDNATYDSDLYDVTVNENGTSLTVTLKPEGVQSHTTDGDNSAGEHDDLADGGKITITVTDGVKEYEVEVSVNIKDDGPVIDATDLQAELQAKYEADRTNQEDNGYSNTLWTKESANEANPGQTTTGDFKSSSKPLSSMGIDEASVIKYLEDNSDVTFGADGAATSESISVTHSLVIDKTASTDNITSGGNPVTFSYDAEGNVIGTITVGGVTETVFKVGLDDSGNVYLQQFKPLDHAENKSIDPDSGVNADDFLELKGIVDVKATITVTDGDGDTTTTSVTADLILKFQDDNPDVAANDEVTVAPSGSVEGSILNPDDKEIDYGFDDGNFEDIEVDGNKGTLNEETGNLEFELDYGKLEVRPDGSFEVTVDKDYAGDGTENFEITVFDKDGDSDSTQVTVNINDTKPEVESSDKNTPAKVTEVMLDPNPEIEGESGEGSKLPTDDSNFPRQTVGEGVVTINIGDNGYQDTDGDGTGTFAESFAWDLTKNDDGSYANQPNITSTDGTGIEWKANGTTLEGWADGVKILTVVMGEPNATTGETTYTVTLYDSVQHADGDGHNKLQGLDFGFTVTDKDGDQAGGTAGLTIQDDIASITSDTDGDGKTEGTADAATGKVNATIGVDFGADMEGATVTTNTAGTMLAGVIFENGAWRPLTKADNIFVDEKINVEVAPDGQTMKVGDSTYIYNQTTGEWDITYTFGSEDIHDYTLTFTDGDGDSVKHTITAKTDEDAIPEPENPDIDSAGRHVETVFLTTAGANTASWSASDYWETPTVAAGGIKEELVYDGDGFTVDTGIANDTVQLGQYDDVIYLGESHDPYLDTNLEVKAANEKAGIDGFMYDSKGNIKADSEILDADGYFIDSVDKLSTNHVDMANGHGGNDKIYGEEGTDLIMGGDGDDYIHGGSGDDALRGGTGNDTIYGGSGNDVIYGGDGNDLLIGGTGDDILMGGEGNDTFKWENNFLKGNDTITDFNTDEDLLDLSSLQSKGYSFEVTSNDKEANITIYDSSNNIVDDASITLKGSGFDSQEIENALNTDGTFGFKS